MVEKLIWQANFDTTFPNNGGYGFNYRDGSPSATGTLSTNLTVELVVVPRWSTR